MINYKQILEAVNRGIKFALDDFEDDEEIQGQTNSKVKYKGGIKDYIDLMKIVVDLGLPSGNLWCKYNLGCNYKKLNNDPENTIPDMWYGDYYAWGQIKPLSLEDYDKAFSSDVMTLDIDPSYQNMHFKDFKFFTPTDKDLQELLTYTTRNPIKNYQIKQLNGLELISKINGNTIFFPCNGVYYNGNISIESMGVEKNCYYYLANTGKTSADIAKICDFQRVGEISKDFFCGIRPVLNLNKQ